MTQNPASPMMNSNEESSLPKKRAFLMILTGQGDTEVAIIDAPTFRFIQNGGECPGYLLQEILENETEAATKMNHTPPTIEEIKERVENFEGSSPDNDRAFEFRNGSFFNGERYTASSVNVKEIQAFCEEHNLKLEEATYEGAIY